MRADSHHNPTSLIDFLQRHDGAAGLLPAAERILKLRRDLFAMMPVALVEACEIAAFEDGTVTLRVASASVAAKLRQTLPRLQEGLVARGWNVTAIRVRVKPRLAVEPASAWLSPRRPAISSEGIAAFSDLGQTLEDSPLKAAVERLIRRRAKP